MRSLNASEKEVRKRKITIKKKNFSNNAHFLIERYVNKQNYKILGRKHPRKKKLEKILQPVRVTLWYAIGPYVCQNEEDDDADYCEWKSLQDKDNCSMTVS